MIKVLIKRENNIINNINIKGHALYDELGKDIVCAAASSILITSVNAILEIDKNAISYDQENNINIINIKKDEITNKLLNNLVNLLKELESKYKRNIQIKEE